VRPCARSNTLELLKSMRKVTKTYKVYISVAMQTIDFLLKFERRSGALSGAANRCRSAALVVLR
jgi:hypothetical protein